MVVVDADYLKEVAAARNELKALIVSKQCAPLMLRLAFHDAGTFDAKAKTGGTNGSIRFELGFGANGGFQFGVDLVEQVKKKRPKVTYADLYQLGGVVAVEVTGGPAIQFVPGRDDAPAAQPDNANGLPFPSFGPTDLRTVFKRMGFTDKEIVLLSGAHTLGGAKPEVSGNNGPFTHNRLKFDNSYYQELLKGDTPGLVKFRSDKALVEDPDFKKLVEIYAKDQNKFFHDYAETHKKMSELG